jgi:hypothetical protein
MVMVEVHVALVYDVIGYRDEEKSDEVGSGIF